MTVVSSLSYFYNHLIGQANCATNARVRRTSSVRSDPGKGEEITGKH